MGDLFDSDEGFLEYIEAMNEKHVQLEHNKDPNIVFQSSIVAPSPGNKPSFLQDTLNVFSPFSLSFFKKHVRYNY
jgi:hypothetical protein